MPSNISNLSEVSCEDAGAWLHDRVLATGHTKSAGNENLSKLLAGLTENPWAVAAGGAGLGGLAGAMVGPRGEDAREKRRSRVSNILRGLIVGGGIGGGLALAPGAIKTLQDGNSKQQAENDRHTAVIARSRAGEAVPEGALAAAEAYLGAAPQGEPLGFPTNYKGRSIGELWRMATSEHNSWRDVATNFGLTHGITGGTGAAAGYGLDKARAAIFTVPPIKRLGELLPTLPDIEATGAFTKLPKGSQIIPENLANAKLTSSPKRGTPLGAQTYEFTDPSNNKSGPLTRAQVIQLQNDSGVRDRWKNPTTFGKKLSRKYTGRTLGTILGLAAPFFQNNTPTSSLQATPPMSEPPAQ